MTLQHLRTFGVISKTNICPRYKSKVLFVKFIENKTHFSKFCDYLQQSNTDASVPVEPPQEEIKEPVSDNDSETYPDDDNPEEEEDEEDEEDDDEMDDGDYKVSFRCVYMKFKLFVFILVTQICVLLSDSSSNTNSRQKGR